MVTGKNGIIKQAIYAKEKTGLAEEKEALMSYLLSEEFSRKESKLGKPLLDRTLGNGESWDIIVTETNQIYGTDYYYIEEGTTIPGYGEAKYNLVVNYKTGDIIDLGESTSYTELTVKDSVAVTDGLVLNIDASNLSSDDWGENITKHGSVGYDKETNAISFNRSGEQKGDYLEVTKAGDFKNGFTFEIYMNLDELNYDNGSGQSCAGFFCKMPRLDAAAAQAMRVGYTWDGAFCKFNGASSVEYKGTVLETTSYGNVNIQKGESLRY